MSKDETDNNGTGRRVQIEIPARMIREWEDGSARVDADGIEIPVHPDEWQYVDSDGDGR